MAEESRPPLRCAPVSPVRGRRQLTASSTSRRNSRAASSGEHFRVPIGGAVELPIACQRNAFARYFQKMRGRKPLDADDQAIVVRKFRTMRRARASSSIFFGTMPAPCKALGNDAKAKSLPGL